MKARDWKISTADLGREDFTIGARNEVEAATREAVASVREGMGQISGMSADASVGLDNQVFLAEIDRCNAELKKLSAMKADPEVDLDTKAFDVAAATLVAKKEALEKKIKIPVDIDRSLLDRGSGALRKLNKDLDEGRGHLGSWLSSLSRVRVQMGPFSGSVRQIGIAFGLLGPLIIHLIGGLSSLVGVLGTGLTGAVVVSGAALTGFGLVVAGLLPSLKQLFTELKTAPSVVGPLRKMRDTLTGDIRQDFFQMAHQGVATLQADFPVFRRGATAAFGAAEQGWRRWMVGLRSDEAQGVLKDILGGFTQGLPALMQGLGTLGATLGRVLGSAAGFLPGLNSGFADWAQNLSDSIGSGNALDQKIGRLVGHMQDLGHMFQATGRVLVGFFNAGADSGDNLVQAITRSENRWADWMNTVEGKNSLQEFFSRSATGTQQFVQLLTRAGELLVNISAVTRPLGDAFITATAAAADLVNALMSMGATRVALQAIGGTLLAIFAVQKVSAFVSGIRDTISVVRAWIATTAAKVAAVTGETVATEANTVAQVENTAAQASAAGAGGASAASWARTTGAVTANTAAELENVAATEAAAVAQGELAVASGTAGTAMAAEGAASGGVLARLGGFAAAMGPLATIGVTLGVIVAGGFALNAIFGTTDNTAKNFAHTLGNFQQALRTARVSENELTAAHHASADGWRQVNKLTDQGKEDTKGYRQAVRAAATADEHAATAQQHHIRSVTDARSNLTSLNDQYETSRDRLIDLAQSGLRPGNDLFDAQAKVVTSLATNVRLATLNFHRLKQGVADVGPSMLKALNQIKQVAGRQTALKFRFSDAGVTAGIGRVSARLNQLGRRAQVIAILANSAPAEQKLAQLQHLLGIVTKPKHVNVGADDQASPKLEHIKARIDALKDKTAHIAANDAASGKLQRIQALIAALHDKAVTITTTHVDRTVRATGSRPAGAPAPGSHAAGATRFAGGPAIINERGPEMALLGGAAWMLGNGRPGAQLDFVPRDAAILTARETAKLLAIGFPAFGKGKKAHKSKKKGAPAGDLDDATSPSSRYSELEDLVSYDASLVDLTKRRYDLGQGASLSDLIGAIGTEIGDYNTLANWIQNKLINDPVSKKVAVPPPLSKKAAKKHPGKANRRQAAIDKATKHNEAIDNGQPDLVDEVREIRNIIIPGLELDKIEATNAQTTGQTLGSEPANALRQQVFSQFASNIAGGVTAPLLGSGGLGVGTRTSAAITGLGAGTSAAERAGALGSGSTSAVSAATGPAGGTTVQIEQHFAAPPKDPHTYAQGVAFEIGAAVA